MYLDAVLADTPLAGGIEPMLGDWHLRTVSVLGFPNTTRPGFLDEHNRLGFASRWVTRFLPPATHGANSAFTRLHLQWFATRNSIVAILPAVLSNSNDTLPP